jgi:hypothetical protein
MGGHDESALPDCRVTYVEECESKSCFLTWREDDAQSLPLSPSQLDGGQQESRLGVEGAAGMPPRVVGEGGRARLVL